MLVLGIILIGVWIFLLLSLYGSFLKSEKERAKRFFKIYKILKIQKPTVAEREIVTNALVTYFKQSESGWNEFSALTVFRYILQDGIKLDEVDGIKEIAKNLLAFEKSSRPLSSGQALYSCEIESLKREKNINRAYKEVFGIQSEMR